MNSLKYNYALKKDGVSISINEAKKGELYFFGKTDKELIVRNGDINQKHFSLKFDNQSGNNKGFSNPESPEHYNAKYKILNDGYFIVDGLKIQPFKIEVEYYIKQTGQISDVVFLDKDENLMCIIEILKSNAKTENDIIKFNKLNTTVYEYNIGNETTGIISWSKNSDRIKKESDRKIEAWYEQKTKEKLLYIERDTKKIEQLMSSNDNKDANQEIRVIEFKQGNINRETTKIEGFSKEFNNLEKSYRNIESRVKITDNESRGVKNSIKELTGNIIWCEKEIEKINESTGISNNIRSRIENANKAIQRVKGNIGWQNNRSGQFKTISQRGY